MALGGAGARRATVVFYLDVLFTQKHTNLIKIVVFLFALVPNCAPEKPPYSLRSGPNLKQKLDASTLIFINE